MLPIIVEGASASLDALPDSVTELSTLQRASLGIANWDENVERIVYWVAKALDREDSMSAVAYPLPDSIKQIFTPVSPEKIEQVLASGLLEGWSVRPVVTIGEAHTCGQ